MLAISLGYPLGVDQDKFLVQYKGKIHRLSYKKAAVWMQFNGVKEIEALNEEKTNFEELIADGLIVAADSVNHLLDGIGKSTPIRQGAGSLTDNKITIFLGDKSTYPSLLQWKIWLQCDGTKPLYELYSTVKKVLEFNSADFLMALNILDKNDLLYLV